MHERVPPGGQATERLPAWRVPLASFGRDDAIREEPVVDHDEPSGTDERPQAGDRSLVVPEDGAHGEKEDDVKFAGGPQPLAQVPFAEGAGRADPSRLGERSGGIEERGEGVDPLDREAEPPREGDRDRALSAPEIESPPAAGDATRLERGHDLLRGGPQLVEIGEKLG